MRARHDDDGSLSVASACGLLQGSDGRSEGALHQSTDGNPRVPGIRSPLALHLRCGQAHHGPSEASR